MELKPGYKHTEVGVIPADWVIQSLGELGSFKNGINKAAEHFGHGFPFVNLMDVFGIPKAAASTENLGLVDSTEAEQRTYELLSGDVLFVRSSVKPEGVGLTTLIPKDLTATVFSGFLIRFRDLGQLTNEFKEHCFLGDGFRRRVVANSTVSANTNINQDALKRLQIGYPPTHNEQRAIAAALSDVDALLGGLDRLIAKKRNLKQAAMQQLLTGQIRLPGFDRKWEVKRLGELCEIDPENLGVGTDPKYRFKYISLEDVDGGQLLSFIETDFSSGPSRARRKLQSDDILVSTVRPNLKAHLHFKQNTDEWVCSTGFAVLRFVTGRSSAAFIYQHLFGNYINQQIDKLITGSNYPAINSGHVRELEIPAPCFVEQTAIASILSDMDAELEVLVARRDKTRAFKQAMMQELLTGKTRLVPPGGAHA